MPRSTEQILAHADELARRFAEHEPANDRIMDARALRDIATAVERRAVAERDIADAVTVARRRSYLGGDRCDAWHLRRSGAATPRLARSPPGAQQAATLAWVWCRQPTPAGG